MQIRITRRRLLGNAALLPLAISASPALEGCSNSGQACSDPDLLSTGETHLRSTLEYIERAPDSGMQCSSCQFFNAKAGADGRVGSQVETAGGASCGYCEILNGAVSSRGYCSSWAT